MNNIKGKNIIIMLLIIITILFFSYGVVITYDSSHYLWLTSLLKSSGNFSDWDILRGPVFPLIIRTFNIFFGESSNGVLAGMFIFYLVMLFVCYLIYKETLQGEEYFNKYMKYIYAFVFLFLVVFNPMIIGFYHTLLTEFVAITLGVIGCYVSWKWMQIDFDNNKAKYIIYTGVLLFLIAVAWFLKQPYISTILFPMIIGAIISIVRKPNCKNFLQRFISLICCLFALGAGLKLWGIVQELNGIQKNNSKTSSGFLAYGIASGIMGYGIPEETITISEAIEFWLSEFGKNPAKVIGKYIKNYFATISILDIEFDNMKIIINPKIDVFNTAEIENIGFTIYEYGNECIFSLPEQYEQYAEPYRRINTPIIAINWIMRKLEIPVTIAMKLCYLVLPILTIISIIFVFKSRKRYNEKLNKIIDIIAILFTYSFLNIILYSFLGSTIDRYTMPSLVTTFLGILLSIYVAIYRKKYKKEDIKLLK